MKKIDVTIVMMDNGYAVSSTIYPGYNETKTIHRTVEEALDKAVTLVTKTFSGFKKTEEERLLASGDKK